MRKFITEWGVPLIAFFLPWQTRWIFGSTEIDNMVTQFGIYSLFAVEILVVVIFFAIQPLKIKKIYHPTLWLTGALLVVVALSFGNALDGSLALISWMHFGIAMLFFILLLDERVSFYRVFGGLVIGLIVPALIGLWQFFVGSSEASTWLGMASRDALRLGDSVIEQNGKRFLRAYGSFSHPNIFGGYLSVGIVGILGFWDQIKKNSTFILVGIAGFILSFGLILTFSRSAWLGLMLGLLLGTIVSVMKNTTRAKMIVIPLAVIIIGTFVFGATGRLGITSSIESRSITERAEQYGEFTSVVGSKWMLGLGLGNYTLASSRAIPGKAWWQYQPIHNVPLLIIGEIGLIGFAVVIIWAASIDAINFRRFGHPSFKGEVGGGSEKVIAFALCHQREAVIAFMMGNTILVIAFLDHYLWSCWSGLALVAFVMAATLRLGEKK